LLEILEELERLCDEARKLARELRSEETEEILRALEAER
jgi:hypothetical protein